MCSGDVWRVFHWVFGWAIFGLIGPLACKPETVEVSVPSVIKSFLSSLQSVPNHERIDLCLAPNIYKEACEIAGVKELTMPRIVEVQVYREKVCAIGRTVFSTFRISPYVDGLSWSLCRRFSYNPSFFALL